MLNIENLYAQAGEKPILQGLDLQIRAGEVHAIMGPNGAGKSTLSNILAGREGYTVSSGQITFNQQDLLALSPEERACAGIFLSFQYPVEIPGVSNMYLLKAALNAKRKYNGLGEIDALEFLSTVNENAAKMQINKDFLKRGVNEGFSGGEKKRNEILQMLILQPQLCILDETDSGLDIDALKIVADGINLMRSRERGILMVTHYQRLLDYVQPDYVHVLANGKIIKSGDASLALELEAKGYGWLL